MSRVENGGAWIFGGSGGVLPNLDTAMLKIRMDVVAGRLLDGTRFSIGTKMGECSGFGGGVASELLTVADVVVTKKVRVIEYGAGVEAVLVSTEFV